LNSVRRLELSAYSGILVFGISLALLGAIVAPLGESLHFDKSGIGTLYAFLNAGSLVASFAIGFVMDRYGMKFPLAAGPLAVAASLVLLARATSYPELFPGVTLLGIGGGMLNASTNGLIDKLYPAGPTKSSALNFLGIFFGIGALLIPFVISGLLSTYSVATILLGTALLCLAAGLYPFTLRFPPGAATLRLADLLVDLRQPPVWLLGLLFFLHSGAEFTLNGYATTHLKETHGLSIAQSTLALGGYWAALMAARIGLSKIISRWNPLHVLTGCALAATAASLLLALAPSAPLAVAGLLLTAFSYSGLFPTALAVAGTRYPARAGSLFGLLVMSAMAGGMTLPYLTGLLSSRITLPLALLLIPTAFALFALLTRPLAPGAPKSS